MKTVFTGRDVELMFNIYWCLSAAKGLCDPVGGHQYRRVLAMYRTARMQGKGPVDLEEFIKQHANKPATGKQ